MLQHGPVVSAEVWLTFRAVYDNGIDLAARALDLEGRREHGASHADDASFADPRDDGIRVAELFFGQRLHILAGRILEVVLDDDGHDHVAQHMPPGLHRYDLSGDRCVYRSGHRRIARAYELPHLHRVAHLDDGPVRRADLLDHRQHDNRRRRDGAHRRLAGGFCVVRVNTAIVLKGHEHHLSYFLTR